MELHKKSELSVGRASFVISTGLAGDAEPSIETRVVGSDGAVVFQTSQDISALKPIFQNSQKVFARLEAQHHAVVQELEQGRKVDPLGLWIDRGGLVPARDLEQAQVRPVGVLAHEFGIDRDEIGAGETLAQLFERLGVGDEGMDVHWRPS